MAQRWFNPILNSQNFQFIIHRSKTRQPVFILAMCSSSRDSSAVSFRAKGQLILKADWCAIDSPKKRTDELVLFAFLLFMANKSNSPVRFLGESTARQSAFRFFLTFSGHS